TDDQVRRRGRGSRGTDAAQRRETSGDDPVTTEARVARRLRAGTLTSSRRLATVVTQAIVRSAKRSPFEEDTIQGETMSKEPIATIEPGAQQFAALRQIASQATPKEEIRWRKGRGGQDYPYTDAAYVIRTLNEAFGWDWDCEVDNGQVFYVNDRPFEVACRVRLTVRLNGKAVVKMQYGCQPIDYLKDGITPVSIGDAHKGAATDGLKKCASELGIALDLYDSDSPIHQKNGQKNGQPRTESQQSK